MSSPTGATILAGGASRLARVAADRSLEIWDWERGARIAVIAAKNRGERLAPLCFAAAGGKLFLSRLSGGVVTREEWDVASGRLERSWETDSSAARHLKSLVALAPGQKYFISKSNNETLVRTDLSSGCDTPLPLNLWNAPVVGSFSPDGSLFAAPTWNGLVHVVGVDPLRHVTTLSGGFAAAHSAVFSPDGKRLAIGSGSAESITLWEVGSFDRLLSLRTASSVFRQAAFSLDGNVLGAISGSWVNPTLNFWRAPSLAEIEAAEAAQEPR